MQIDSRLSSLIHLLSPRNWLLVALASIVLASGSALVLVSRFDDKEKDLPGHVFDLVERFLRDTIRLTFKDRKSGEPSDDVFVAPKGILDKGATFKWVDNSQDFEARPEEAPPEPTAPTRLLDPEWKPDFPGIPQD